MYFVVKFVVTELEMSVPEESKHWKNPPFAPAPSAEKHAPATPPCAVGSFEKWTAALVMAFGLAQPVHAAPVIASIQTAFRFCPPLPYIRPSHSPTVGRQR